MNERKMAGLFGRWGKLGFLDSSQINKIKKARLIHFRRGGTYENGP